MQKHFREFADEQGDTKMSSNEERDGKKGRTEEFWHKVEFELQGGASACDSFDTSVFSSDFDLDKTFHDCAECLQELDNYINFEYEWN